MARVELKDTLLTSIIKMSEGNPGACTALTELINKVPDLDPDCALGGLHYLLHMDDFGLYGGDIWMLFKDVCGEKIEGVITLFRAYQLGFLPEKKLRQIIREDQPYDVTPLVAQIQSEIPYFMGGAHKTHAKEPV